jgi:peroxiredoxin
MTADFPLPAGLPAPADDGAAAHLRGTTLPDLDLPATDGSVVHLRSLGRPRTVLFLYPMTGRPGTDLPAGWDDIPGARGCTPEASGFRDLWTDLRALGAEVFGLSSQSTDYQREAAERLQLPFPLLSDSALRLAELLALPTFEVDGHRMFKRLSMVVHNAVVEHVFYPVFPPDGHAAEVLAWLQAH